MKLSIPTGSHRAVLALSARRIEWSWCGFGAGLLGYVVLSAVFETLPDATPLKAIWLAVGLAPALIGSCIGFALAVCISD